MLTLNNYSLFIWNSVSAGHPVPICIVFGNPSKCEYVELGQHVCRDWVWVLECVCVFRCMSVCHRAVCECVYVSVCTCVWVVCACLWVCIHVQVWVCVSVHTHEQAGPRRGREVWVRNVGKVPPASESHLMPFFTSSHLQNEAMPTRNPKWQVSKISKRFYANWKYKFQEFLWLWSKHPV